MQRREFLKQTASAALALTAADSLGAANQDRPLPIVDTHVHLWDLTRFRLPWITKESPLARSYVIKDYLTATQGLNVVKGVYMEVDVEVKQQKDEGDYVLDICRRADTPLAAAVISGRPADEGFRKYLESFKGNRFLKGVRQVLHVPSTPAGFCTRPEFVRGIRVLEEMGLSYDLCMRPTDLGDAVRLVEMCPKMRFILDHCGNGPTGVRTDRTQWQRDMDRLARNQNVMCKISGIVAGAREKWTEDDLAPVINHSLNAFGPDRVMFAGDWPVCTLRATFRRWVDTLKAIVRGRPADQQRKLFHDNAMRFYGLRA